MRWYLISTIVGIVLLAVGAGVAVVSYLRLFLRAFIYLATGAVVFLLGAASTGYGAYSWRKHGKKPATASTTTT
jgi:hypothetical protein